METSDHLDRAFDDLTARVRKLTPWHGESHLPGGRDDQSPVPENLISRLIFMAGRTGHQVTFEKNLDEGPAEIVGMTLSVRTPWGCIPGGIKIQDGLTEASTVRVLCHELAHALIGHTTLRVGNSVEEAIVEMAAGMVTQLLGCTDGRFSAQYVANYTFPDAAGRLRQARPVAVAIAGEILRNAA